MKRALIILLIFSASTHLSSQSSFRYGAEVGCALPDDSENRSVVQGDEIRQYTISATGDASPLVGLASELTLKSYLKFGFGIQYQKKSVHRYEHWEVFDRMKNCYYRNNVAVDQSVQKLCLPMLVGLGVKLGIFKPSVFVGMRPNLILTGLYHSKRVTDHDIDSLDSEYEWSFNSFIPPGRIIRFYNLLGQYFYGVSTFIGESIKLSFTVCKGGGIYYAEPYPSCFGHSMNNNDYLISIGYYFNKPKKKKTVCGIGTVAH